MQEIISRALEGEAVLLALPLVGTAMVGAHWAQVLPKIKAALPGDTATTEELLREAGAWPADMPPHEYRYRATLQFMRIAVARRAGR